MSVDWDDLRFLDAVARHGSLAAAARALGVTHTTVLRRVVALEAKLGQSLFDRRPQGYTPSDRVADVLSAAAAIEHRIRALEAELSGGDLHLEGAVRLTCSDTAAMLLIPGALAGFREAHPAITVELVASETILDLARREADVAVRQTAVPPNALYGRKIARLAFAWYAAPALQLTKAGLADAPLLLPDGRDDDDATAQSYHANAQARVAFRASSPYVLREVSRAGMGAAFLACYAGDGTPGLVRVTKPQFEPACDLWVLTHERIRRVPRVRALTEFLAHTLAAQRDLIEGERPAT